MLKVKEILTEYDIDFKHNISDYKFVIDVGEGSCKNRLSYTEGTKIFRFEINLASVEATNLLMSSRKLTLVHRFNFIQLVN